MEKTKYDPQLRIKISAPEASLLRSGPVDLIGEQEEGLNKEGVNK